jgi:hypothetical protein
LWRELGRILEQARQFQDTYEALGRKRHILTDTDGRLLAVRVHAADVQDRDRAKLALKASRARFPFVQTVFADGGYAGRLEACRTSRSKARAADPLWPGAVAARGINYVNPQDDPRQSRNNAAHAPYLILSDGG